MNDDPPPLPERRGPPPVPRPVLPLGYSPPSKPPGRSMRARRAIGFGIYLALLVAWVRAGVVLGARPATIAGGWAVMTVILLGVALYLRVRHGKAGYGYGILSALASIVLVVGGLVLLIIGLCRGMRI